MRTLERGGNRIEDTYAGNELVGRTVNGVAEPVGGGGGTGGGRRNLR